MISDLKHLPPGPFGPDSLSVVFLDYAGTLHSPGCRYTRGMSEPVHCALSEVWSRLCARCDESGSIYCQTSNGGAPLTARSLLALGNWVNRAWSEIASVKPVSINDGLDALKCIMEEFSPESLERECYRYAALDEAAQHTTWAKDYKSEFWGHLASTVKGWGLADSLLQDKTQAAVDVTMPFVTGELDLLKAFLLISETELPETRRGNRLVLLPADVARATVKEFGVDAGYADKIDAANFEALSVLYDPFSDGVYASLQNAVDAAVNL